MYRTSQLYPIQKHCVDRRRHAFAPKWTKWKITKSAKTWRLRVTQCFWMRYNWVLLYIYLLSDDVTTEWSFTQIESVAPVTEQKTMKLTFEILILKPLSIFKQIEYASRICIHHDFKNLFCRFYVNWFLFSNATQCLLDRWYLIHRSRGSRGS